MDTIVTEITNGIYRFSTYIDSSDLRFNQFLIDAEEPLLFHCGFSRLFPQVSEAVSRVIPLERIRWISYGHHEADESGAMNKWLEAAPKACVVLGRIGCMLSATDLALREPKPLQDGETLELGGKRVRYLATPHVPHCWDAGLLYEEITQTLLCGDLFTQIGDCKAMTEDDIVGPALQAEDMYQATALTANTAPTIRRLAALSLRTLGLMHGPAFQGDGALVLQQLADGYDQRFQMDSKAKRASA
ncbi:MAG: MBL fold metallo-hydrolase [Acidobacteriia bacterium]|nr:MBL fold metallo-hydrolase [Terriglobia bacterium]